VSWDGNDSMGHPVDTGIYSYLISAQHGVGALGCNDQDKSPALQLNIPMLTNWVFSVPNMTVTSDLTHSASQDGVDFAWSIYDPATIFVGGGSHSPATAIAHTDATTFQVNPTGCFGDWTYVLSENENATQAANNRNGAVKPALQVGVTMPIWPNAIDIPGLNYGVDWPNVDARVADAVAKQSTGDGASHYSALEDLPNAGQAYSDLSKCAVFHYCGHADPNAIDLSGWNIYNQLHGGFPGAQQDNDPASLEYWLANMPGGALRHCLFAYYEGCHSGASDNDANLLDMTITKGATCAMGFTDELEDGPWSVLFDGNFWQYTARDDWYVLGAATRALGDVMQQWGMGHGYESLVVRGDTKLMPAKFGG
jgi:hypothetical protein